MIVGKCRLRLASARLGCLAVLLLAGRAVANEAPVAAPAAVVPAVRTTLPRDYDYQRTLIAYLATLTEDDFDHKVTTPLTVVPGNPEAEYQYRAWLFTLMLQPMIGTKRGAPSVNAPPSLFVLSNIESPTGVLRPPVWPDALIAFERWPYAGNSFHNNRALRLRAFVTAAVNLMMLDDYLDHTPTACRTDRVGPHLIYACVPYLGSKAILPPTVQQAYEAGVLRFGQRVLAMPPKGEEPNLDLTVPVALWYASQVVHDAEFSQAAEAYARKMLTDPRYFHPAGYFIERGGVDLGYGGMSNFFAVWLALASQWEFAQETVNQLYRLHAHLILPEPDGRLAGPSAFNARIGSPPHADQWNWETGLCS